MNIYYKLRDIKYNIKWFFQRGRKGYCDNDLYCLHDWFIKIFPKMLKEFNEMRHGYPCDLTEEQWDKIVKDIIFYLEEADEDKCSRKNKYAEQHHNALEEFTEKYGLFGQKLRNEQDEKLYKEKGLISVHTMGELDEYKDIDKKWLEECDAIEKYRNDCKDKAFKLISKYFWNLWD